MDDENKDLNDENDTQEDQSSSENDSDKGSEPLENAGELAARADKLLDGTLKDKDIRIPKKKYDELKGKADIYEAHAPLLDKVLKDPDFVENLLETKDKGNVEDRLKQLEEERKADKRKEIRDAVTYALSTWGDFEKSFSEIQPIADALFKQGVSYVESLRRGYLAVHPEAAEAESKRVATENLNVQGKFSSASSYSPRPSQFKKDRELTIGEKQVASALGKSEEDYGKLLDKHEGWLKSRGFYSLDLEKPLSEEL